jgi:hypothetical protein
MRLEIASRLDAPGGSICRLIAMANFEAVDRAKCGEIWEAIKIPAGHGRR